MRRIALAVVMLACLWANVWAADNPQLDAGLVAHYPFDEGAGAVAHDRSGNGNDGKIIGGAKWTKGKFGSALEFNGKDGYVDCGMSKSLNIASQGTVMLWCRPRSNQGGLANFGADETWRARLMFAVDLYHGGGGVRGCMANGETGRDFVGFGRMVMNEWVHFAYTFDDKIIHMYRDGALVATWPVIVKPNLDGAYLWIGRTRAGVAVRHFFHGLLDEVRVYNRPLSAKEIRRLYRKDAPGRGKDMTIFRRPSIETQVYRGPGKIVVKLNSSGMQPLPEGSRLQADLCKPGKDRPIRRLETCDIIATDPAEVIFDAADLDEDYYALRARVIGPNKKQIGEERSVLVEWPGRLPEFKNIKILNNLCWELLNVHSGLFGEIDEKQEFTLPYDRWVLIRTTAVVGKKGKISVRLDSDPKDVDPIRHSKQGKSTLEAMRYLKAGKHAVVVTRQGKAHLRRLVVRAVPELQHAFYGADSRLRPYGPYDWDFLKKDVLPNVNTMLAGLEHYRRGDAFDRLKEWKRMGRKWVSYKWIPREFFKEEGDPAEKFYKFWSDCAAYQNPLVDGLIVDEFYGGDRTDYDVYSEVVKKLNSNPEFKGTAFYPYCDLMNAKDRSSEFGKVCMEGGGYLCWEAYFSEVADQAEARRIMYRKMVNQMPFWEEAIPGCTRRMVIVLCYMSAPTESSNRRPDVDFNVFMDMQMNLIANHPAFFGLGGLQEYHCGYSDEENVRWAGRLYRHYALEGNTEPINDDPYNLTHISNPDFAEGTEGWNIQPAEKDSIQAKSYKRYGRMQSRWPETSDGDTFLWMKRSAGKPNKFSQEIKHLTPGRLYSMKMITADYQNLINGVSERKTNAVSIKLDNVEILPGDDKSFQFSTASPIAAGKFTTEKKLYTNYHWRVFRAKKKTAKLTVSDWKSDTEPGGPIGQELMYNFIEIQPYIESQKDE